MSISKCLCVTGTVFLACLLGSVSALGAPQETESWASLRIDQLRREFNRAYNAGDASRLGSLLAQDAVWMPPGEPFVVGRGAIQRRYEAQFAGTRSIFTLEPGEIRVTLNQAWLRGEYQRIDTSVAGGPPNTTTGKYLMTFSLVRGDWKITSDIWNANVTPLVVDPQVALDSLRALAEWRLTDVAGTLKLLASTDQVKSGDWNTMVRLLRNLGNTGILANAIWFVRPDGFYYTVEQGFTNLNLSDRSYFPGLMAGHSALGTLVISRSTGKRSVIIAEPVFNGNKVIGGIGISYSVDQLSSEIDKQMQLPAQVGFYALDLNGQAALHRDPSLMFAYPSDLGDDSLRAAVADMLSKPRGVVTYVFRDVRKTVFFMRSSVLNWVFALGFGEPLNLEMR